MDKFDKLLEDTFKDLIDPEVIPEKDLGQVAATYAANVNKAKLDPTLRKPTSQEKQIADKHGQLDKLKRSSADKVRKGLDTEIKATKATIAAVGKTKVA